MYEWAAENMNGTLKTAEYAALNVYNILRFIHSHFLLETTTHASDQEVEKDFNAHLNTWVWSYGKVLRKYEC